MKRVLVVAYPFPPDASGAPQRVTNFVKHLARHEWDPIVLTDKVPVIHDQIGSLITIALGSGSLGQRAGEALWYRLALRAAKRMFRDEGYDAVFASGPPWSMLTLGRAIAAVTNRPFIADFQDLWTAHTAAGEPPSPIAAETDVVAAASAVICTSDRMRQQMSNTHPAIEDARFVAIHDGFDAQDFEHAKPPRADHPLRIVYAGGWTEESNACALYNTVDWIRRSDPRALEGIEIVTAGFAPGEARRRGLSRYIRETGHIAHRDAIRLMESAHVLYFCHNDADRPWSVHGGLYDCLASGTPVIAQTQADGETARLVRRLGGGKVVSADDPGELYYSLLDVCRTRTVQVAPREDGALAPFELRELTAKLAAVLDEAMEITVGGDFRRASGELNSSRPLHNMCKPA